MYEKYVKLGDSLFELCEYNQALDNYTKAKDINNDYTVLNRIANVNNKLSDFSNAISCYNESIELNSEHNLEAYKGLTTVYMKIENYEKAIKFLYKAIEINPNELHFIKTCKQLLG